MPQGTEEADVHSPPLLVGLAQRQVLTALRSCAAGNPEALLAEAEGAILSATLTPNEVTEERKHLLAQRFQARLGQLVLCLEEHRDSILSERDGMALMNALLFEFIDDEFAAGIDEEKARMAPVMRRAWIEFEHQPNPKSLSALTDDWLPSKMGSRTAYLPPSCAWCGSTRSRCCCPSSSPKYRLRRLRRTKSLLRG